MSLRLKISFFSLQVFRILAIAFIKIKNAMDKNFRKAEIQVVIKMIYIRRTSLKIRISSSFREFLILTLALMN